MFHASEDMLTIIQKAYVFNTKGNLLIQYYFNISF